MSMMLMVKAMNTKVGNPLRKLILIKLADNANDKGECWPSHQYIADLCEVSKSTVRKHIKELCECGLLRITHRDGPKGNSSNLYHVTIHPVASESIGMPSDDTPPMPSDDTRTSHSLEPVKEPKKTSLKDEAPTNEAIVNAYNEKLGGKFSRVVALSGKRKAAIKKFIKLIDGGDPAGYFEYFGANCKPFHLGENDRNWKADFDFIIREDTVVKVMEGNL